MSYDLRISVKVAGAEDKYIKVGRPEHDSPTYNLKKMFTECMFWDYDQGYIDNKGNFQTQYYNCEEILPKIIKGINELEKNPDYYKKFEPDNGWGTLENAITTLRSLKDCIYEISDTNEIPINCLYMNW